MWRLNKHLVNQCIYADQEVLFIGSIVATIHGIYVGGQKVCLHCLPPKCTSYLLLGTGRLYDLQNQSRVSISLS